MSDVVSFDGFRRAELERELQELDGLIDEAEAVMDLEGPEGDRKRLEVLRRIGVAK